MSLTRQEVCILAAEAGIDVRTAKRILGGKGRKPRSDATTRSLADALRKRGHETLADKLTKNGRVPSQEHPSWREVGNPTMKQRKKGKRNGHQR
jgi:hypothetical protein